MERYRSHQAHTVAYGSRCEYCLQAWPCDAVALNTRLSAADAAGREVARALQQTRLWVVWSGASVSHIDEQRRTIDAALANPVVAVWLSESQEER